MSSFPLVHSVRRAGRWVLLAVRLLLVLVVLRQLTPAAPRVTLGAPQTVETLHPVVCAHTRMTDEVEEWKIQRTMRMVREMGAATIVEFFPWPYVERQEGQYDWSHPDRIMRHAENQGIRRVIARLGLVPAWARPPVQEKVTTLSYLPEEHFADFAAYVGAFVARYSDQIAGVIIWNEPNLTREWGDRPVDPEAYTELLRLSYEAARAADPDVVVMGGALAPTIDPEDGGAMDEMDFLARMYEAGAAPYFDKLAAHTYGFTLPPEAGPDPDVINFRRIELLRAVMVEYGDADKPVVITESGWNDDPRWANAVGPGQRIVYTLQAFEMVENWPWAEQLCLWQFRQPVDRNNRRDTYFALVSSDFVRRPIYEAVQAYARGWENPYQP